MISNSIIEERYQFIINLYLISKKSKLDFLYNIDFRHNIFNKYMPSIKLSRTDDDIHIAVTKWYNNPIISEKKYGNIRDWDTSRVTNMYRLFCSHFFYNKPSPDISKWDVSNVTNMKECFHFTNFNGYIGNWNTRNVITMEGMFNGSVKFNGDISRWNVKNVLDMKNMFRLTEFNKYITNWEITNLQNTENMFYGVRKMNKNVIKWNLNNIKNKKDMFRGTICH